MSIAYFTRQFFIYMLMIAIAFCVITLANMQHNNAYAQQVEDNQLVVGQADATVTIIEYASLSCPHCANFHRTVYPQIKKEFLDTGIAKLYIRDFPHNDAGTVATVVKRCAPENVQLALYDKMLKEQSNWLNADDVRVPLRQYGALAGISAQQLEQCFQDKAMVSALFDDIKQAQKDGVRGVPSVFIKGKQIDANYKAIAKAIKAAQ
ncbi:MAG: DsbA family protein [Alphaproteobacteria bacterium]|nr:DsbA family protein [Alphaproteobacteria bacterium]